MSAELTVEWSARQLFSSSLVILPFHHAVSADPDLGSPILLSR